MPTYAPMAEKRKAEKLSHLQAEARAKILREELRSLRRAPAPITLALRWFRQRSGRKQTEVARAMGYHGPSAMAAQECYHSPTLPTLRRFAKVYGVKISDIILKMEEFEQKANKAKNDEQN